MKKSIFKVLVTLVLMGLLFLLLTGCNDAGTESTTKSTEKETQKTTEKKEVFDPSMFNVFFENKFFCAVIIPEDPTPIEKLVTKRLETAIMRQTGELVDFIPDSKSADKYEWTILLGNTRYEESKDAYAKLQSNSATAKVKNKRLVIAFSSLSSGIGITDAILDEFRLDPYGIARLRSDYSHSYSLLSQSGGAPSFEHADEIADCGANTTMSYFSEADDFEFSCYCEEIGAAGFEKIWEREEKGNKFVTYVNDKDYVYAYYTAFAKEIRIINGPRDTLAATDYTSGLQCDKDPYIASIPQPGMGQGYILGLPDGRYIIHDGGYKDDDRVYEKLRALQPEGDIVIAAWFISHPHGDHYPAFIDFIRDHYTDEDITLERLIYNYTVADRYNITGSAGVERVGTHVRKLYEAVEQYAPDLPMIKAHTGQVMDFGSATVEILITIEDIMPATLKNTNDSSMAIRVRMGESSIMLLADTCYTSGPKLNKMWGDYLESDIVQVAHHGMWPSIPEIYHSIKGEVVLYSTMYHLLASHVKDDTKWANTTAAVLEYAVDIYVSDAAGEVIMLPYTPKNNKEEMLDIIINYK